MKIKLDENMPHRVEALLQERGHNVDTVREEGNAGRPDAEIARAATEADRMLITLDRGFPASADVSAGRPSVVVLKPGSQEAPIVEATMRHLLDTFDLDDLRDCIVVVSPGQVRIRRSGIR